MLFPIFRELETLKGLSAADVGGLSVLPVKAFALYKYRKSSGETWQMKCKYGTFIRGFRSIKSNYRPLILELSCLYQNPSSTRALFNSLFFCFSCQKADIFNNAYVFFAKTGARRKFGNFKTKWRKDCILHLEWNR